MIIFLHIRKTSGSTINQMLRSQNKVFWYKFFKTNTLGRKISIEGEQVKYTDKEIVLPDMISGHFPYGIHKIFNTNKFSYFTFLRDPIERWKSHFYHSIQSKSSNFLNVLYEKKRSNIQKFLEYLIERDATCNVMTKQLSGTEDLSNICMFKGPPESAAGFSYSQVYGWAARYRTYSNDEMDCFLDEAICNLFNNIDFVGFQEHSKVDYKKLCSLYNFKLYTGKRMKVTKRLKTVDWNNRNVQILLKEANKYDIKLYERAHAKFK